MRRGEFEAKIAEARKYEVALSEWLQERFGCYILPTYDYSGLGDNKAPKLLCGKGGLVIPDLQISGEKAHAFRRGMNRLPLDSNACPC